MHKKTRIERTKNLLEIAQTLVNSKEQGQLNEAIDELQIDELTAQAFMRFHSAALSLYHGSVDESFLKIVTTLPERQTVNVMFVRHATNNLPPLELPNFHSN